VSEDLFTVERVASRLDVHPKTVLRFIRDGRLRATRIGKAYRILRSDLESFAGVTTGAAAARQPTRVTAIVDAPDVSMDVSRRIASTLQAALISPLAAPEPIQLTTAYDPEQGQLKVVIIASPLDTAALLRTLHGLLEAYR